MVRKLLIFVQFLSVMIVFKIFNIVFDLNMLVFYFFNALMELIKVRFSIKVSSVFNFIVAYNLFCI